MFYQETLNDYRHSIVQFRESNPEPSFLFLTWIIIFRHSKTFISLYGINFTRLIQQPSLFDLPQKLYINSVTEYLEPRRLNGGEYHPYTLCIYISCVDAITGLEIGSKKAPYNYSSWLIFYFQWYYHEIIAYLLLIYECS